MVASRLLPVWSGMIRIDPASPVSRSRLSRIGFEVPMAGTFSARRVRRLHEPESLT